MNFCRALVFSLGLIFLPGKAFSFETAYWAWQRNDPPNESDLAEFSAQGWRDTRILKDHQGRERFIFTTHG